MKRKSELQFNNVISDMIGKPYGEIKKIWGNPNGIYAYGGEIGFLFDNTVIYYFSDEYDIKANEPKCGSVCYGAGCKLNTCIKLPEEGTYLFEEIEEKLGVDIFSFITDEEDEVGAGFPYTNEFVYNGMTFTFYSDSMTEAPSGSIVFIKAD